MTGFALALPRKRRRRRRGPRGIEWLLLAVFAQDLTLAIAGTVLFVGRDAATLNPGIVLELAGIAAGAFVARMMWATPTPPGVRCVRRILHDWLIGEPE